MLTSVFAFTHYIQASEGADGSTAVGDGPGVLGFAMHSNGADQHKLCLPYGGKAQKIGGPESGQEASSGSYDVITMEGSEVRRRDDEITRTNFPFETFLLKACVQLRVVEKLSVCNDIVSLFPFLALSNVILPVITLLTLGLQIRDPPRARSALRSLRQRGDGREPGRLAAAAPGQHSHHGNGGQAPRHSHGKGILDRVKRRNFEVGGG